MNKQLKSISSALFLRGGLGVRLLLYSLLLAACTEADELMDRSGATVNFSLSSGVVSPEVSSTRAAVDMAMGTTVRVLAYRRPTGVGSAVLSSANYAGEATYKVTAGSTLTLCGVTLDALGMPAVDETATLLPLQLVAGTYDFYAVTPALAVNHGGSDPTLNVRHYTDYAVSVTSKAISPSDHTVGLTTLDRRCTLLTFDTDRTAGVTNINAVSVGQVTLSSMTTEPIAAVSTQALNIALNAKTATLTLPSGTFITPDASVPYKTRGQGICLPKSSAAFVLKMDVSFNNGSSLLLEAPGITLALNPCKRYAFTVRFKERGGIELLLGVEDWRDAIGSTDVGVAEQIPVRVVIGEWDTAHWDTSIGGTNTPPFTPNISVWDDLDKTLNVGGTNIPPFGSDASDWDDLDKDLNTGGTNAPPFGSDASDWNDLDKELNMGIDKD